ncbi:MAG: diguanylate cyclase [Synergistales bacterium]|nr:diguanylate cyclase [Synergistales bacterium]
MTAEPESPEMIILVCEHFFGEAEAALARLELDDIRCIPFPARCGRPPLSREEVDRIVGECGHPAQIVIIGSCCLEGLEQSLPAGHSCTIVQSATCFEMIAGKTFVENQLRQGGFLATPGWLAHWREWIDTNGFDQTRAREFFKESINGIVLLDTGIDGEANRHLWDFAAFVDQPAITIAEGIDFFTVFLHQRILLGRQQISEDHQRLQRQEQADFAMVLDLLSDLPKATTEQEAFDKTAAVFAMLFAPSHIRYVEIEKENAPQVWLLEGAQTAEGREAAIERVRQVTRAGATNKEAHGFTLRLAGRGEGLRGLDVQGVTFPQYIDRYIQIAQLVANVCGMAIDNARSYERLMENQDRLRTLATTDSLTGIANRGHFMQQTELEIQRAGRYGSAFSLLSLDVDNFKQINDTYGHPTGDRVLQELAALFKNNLRANDYLGRIGGEEFAVCAVETSLDGGREIAERIRKDVAGHAFESCADRIGCTVSIGVTAYHGGDDTLAQMLKRADTALYQAKEEGRNRVAVK